MTTKNIEPKDPQTETKSEVNTTDRVGRLATMRKLARKTMGKCKGCY